jgi:hypothetical protein
MYGYGYRSTFKPLNSGIDYQQKIIDRNPHLYLDATDSIKTLNGSNIASITSLVGITSATQGTDTYRPVLGTSGNYNTMGFNLLGGNDDDFLALPGSFNIGVFDTTFSISFVIQPDNPKTSRYFFGFLDGVDGVRIQYVLGKLSFIMRAGGNIIRWRSGGQVFPDDRLIPQLITFTFDNSIQGAGGVKGYADDGNGGRITLTNDGSLTGDTSGFDANDWTSTDEHWIGYYNDGDVAATNKFEGDINAVIIDSKVITEEEFLDMVNLYVAP